MEKKLTIHGLRPCLTQKLRIIDLILFLFLFSFVNSFASDSYSQVTRLSILAEQMPIEDFFSEIESKSEFRFFYTGEIDVDKKISGDFKNMTITEILDVALKDENIEYEVKGRQVVLSSKKVAKEEKDVSSHKMITGQVTDATGAPLTGVTVMVKGSTTNGVITDSDGKYSLMNVPKDGILVFSFLGMQTQEVSVSGKAEISVTMQDDVIGLSEVIAVGYGTMKKADLTGSVSSIKGDDLKKVSAANVATAIAGKLPGLQVTQATGEPGGYSIIRMRGLGSVYSGSDPLVLIDGFPGSLSQISSSDVESISVLKDAASASIYGSRAANGVILVTTKSGQKNQKIKIELNAKYGVQKATNIPELLESEEWCRKMNESTELDYWVGDNAPENQTTNTDWLGYLFRDDAPVQNYNISASGGTQNLRYSMNVGYYDQDGIMINQNYNKYNLRTSIDYSSDNLNVGVKTYQMRSKNTSNINHASTVMCEAFLTPPTIPVYNADGLPGTPRKDVDGENFLVDNTPSMDALSREYKKTGNYSVSNIYAEIRIIDELRFKTIFNYKTSDTYSEEFFPEWYSYRPDDTEHISIYKANTESKLTVSTSTSSVWESQNVLTYKKDIERHHFDALLGYSAQKSQNANLYGKGSKFPRNSLKSLNAAGETGKNGGAPSEATIISQFGRINYAYDDKYLLQFNIRRDGSSVFGPRKKWSTFPSASLGWRITEERFMKRYDFIDNLKLRAGIGSLGNANIPAGQWYSSIEFWSDCVLGTNQKVNGGAFVGTYNPDISWETTTTYNLGLDVAVFSKLDATFELYKRKTTDMLLVNPLPSTTGFDDKPYVNLGGVDNTGWEFTAQYHDNIGDFHYNVGFNITHVENEVVDMGGVSPIIEDYTRTEEGQAVNSFYGYVVEGFYESEDDIANNPSFVGAKPGDFKYKDISGEDGVPDGVIDENDKTFLGSAMPQFFYGGNIAMSYKGFDLSMFFQGEANKKIMMTPEYGMDFGKLYNYTNMYKEVYENRWTENNLDSKYPALGSGNRGSNNACNTTWLQDAAYLRLKNLQIGYTLPQELTAKIDIESVRVFFNATNLLTFTDYVGFDPEMGTRQKRIDGTGLEMDKVYTRGGCDYPQAKTMELGLTVKF